MSHMYDKDYWEFRSEEALRKAEDALVKEAREAFLYMASVYRGMAARADLRIEQPNNDLARRLRER